MESKTVTSDVDAMAKETRILSVRMPEDLAQLLEELAKREVRSLNGQIIRLIKEAVLGTRWRGEDD